jgi:hypothetical protein
MTSKSTEGIEYRGNGAQTVSGLGKPGPLLLQGRIPDGVDVAKLPPYGNGVVATKPFTAGTIMYDVSALLIPLERVGKGQSSRR